MLEIARRLVEEIGKDKVAIRLSPFSKHGDLAPYDTNEVIETYNFLTAELEKLGIAYLHMSANPDIPDSLYSSSMSQIQ